MKKVKLIDLYKYLKYSKMLTIRYIFTQLKSRYYCKKYHNQWVANPVNFGSGRYNYQQYYCSICGCIHYEFEENKTK